MNTASTPRLAGLAGLVPLAELLGAFAGGRDQAVELAARIVQRGRGALYRGRDDLGLAIEAELRAAGVVLDGRVDPARAGELVAVCEILAMASPPPVPGERDPRLVLSSPEEAVEIADNERLESFILDVIRQARQSLVVGGAFWNDAGFQIIDDVIRPAILTRHVATTLYVNLPDEPHAAVLRRRLSELGALGDVTVRWFAGRAPTMLHAKFVIRDGTTGYLGTANLTSWGMRAHVEAGVEMTPGQCRRFLRFLQQLENVGLFTDRPPTAAMA